MKENYYNCIYMYINKINGKRYIGQAKNFNKRHNEHIRMKMNNTPIDKAFNKYGNENFEIIILKENLSNQCLMNLYECYYIKKYDTLCKNKNGYNIASGGHNGNVFEGKTNKEMNEIRKKMSDKAKVREISHETRNKLSKAKKGENNPNYGKKHSSESRKKISEKAKERYKIKENNPMYGKHHTEETKEKMRKPCSDETKRKISEANKGNESYWKGKELRNEMKEKISKTRKENGKSKGKNNPKAKRVAQYDLDGNLIKIWNYAKQISEELNISYNALKNRLQNKTKTNELNGYIWKYYND